MLLLGRLLAKLAESLRRDRRVNTQKSYFASAGNLTHPAGEASICPRRQKCRIWTEHLSRLLQIAVLRANRRTHHAGEDAQIKKSSLKMPQTRIPGAHPIWPPCSHPSPCSPGKTAAVTACIHHDCRSNQRTGMLACRTTSVYFLISAFSNAVSSSGLLATGSSACLL